jgi:tRNA(Leu) C34 or U34 (ribose-2'-O)-methylase TrmL
MSRKSQNRGPRGFFSIGIYHPKHATNVGTLWRAAHLYGAASIFTIGQRYARQASDTTHADLSIPLLHYRDLDDLIEHLPAGSPLVGVELDPRAYELASYSHPPRACYLLGAEDNGLPQSVIDRCHALVQVESAQPWSHNVSATGSIVLWHRHIQMSRALVAAS